MGDPRACLPSGHKLRIAPSTIRGRVPCVGAMWSCPTASQGKVACKGKADMGETATLIVVSTAAALMGWVASVCRARLSATWQRRRAKRRCAQGRHEMSEWERRTDGDDPHDPRETERILLGCRWCGHKEVIPSDALWDF